MTTGDIIPILFPFTNFVNRKLRPTVVVCETQDIYKDVVLCAISSVLPTVLSINEILLKPDKTNGLRKNSVLKTDRIVTAQSQDIISVLGKLSESDLQNFKIKFKLLVD